MKKKYLYFSFSLLLIIIDQIIKICMINSNNFIGNTGGAFSIGTGNTNILIGLNMILILAVIIAKKFLPKMSSIGTCFIISGGISNLLDRIIRGMVIDYIDITRFINIPIFNLADILITLGVSLLVIQILKGSKQDE